MVIYFQIRIRHETSLSEDSDIDVDVDSDLEKGKDELPLEKKECQKGEVHDITEVVIKEEECVQCKEDVPTSLDRPHNQKEETKEHFVDTKKQKVSLLSGSLEQQEICDKKETQVFKGNLMTPSGKIMTVVVDDMPYELNESKFGLSHNRSFCNDDFTLIEY